MQPFTLFPLKTALGGKSAYLGALISSALGASADVTGLAHPGNTGLFIALCGLAGAFFASLPKIIAARSLANLSSRELHDKEHHNVIARIHDSYKRDMSELSRQVREWEQIIILTRSSRHLLQSHAQAADYRIETLEMLMRDHALETPAPLKPFDFAEILRREDEQILVIRGLNPSVLSAA